MKQYPYGSLLDIKKFVVAFLFFIVSYYFFDIPITEFFNQFQSVIHPIAKCIAVGFNGIVVLGVFSILLLLSFVIPKMHTYKKPLFTLFILLVLGQIFLMVVKVCVGRSRPELWLTQHIYTFKPFTTAREYLSFPSGHTINVILIFSYLAIVCPKYRVIFWCLGFGISFFRVLSLQHYFSDWLFTAYLAACLVPIGYWALVLCSRGKRFKKIVGDFSSQNG
jgi:membrane-associated phospholipid phosphatase